MNRALIKSISMGIRNVHSKASRAEAMFVLLIVLDVLLGTAYANEFWQQNPSDPSMIVYKGPVGIGFDPVTGEQHEGQVSLQLAKDLQTNTRVLAGDELGVNLSYVGGDPSAGQERGGLFLLRFGSPLGELVLESNDDVSLKAANNLYLTAAGGSVIANEIIVRAPGADFVFAKDFQLTTLQELERYIAKHSHLPDIPSAAEMETNGAGLGAMQMKLLQKVEELTLYVIEQNKQLTTQEKQLEAQAKELAELKNTYVADKLADSDN